MASIGGPVVEEPIRWRGDSMVANGEEAEGIDHFDLLPDCLLLVVFNLIGDVKDLGRCRVVCRRFNALAQLVESVLVRIISDDPSASLAAGSGGDRSRGFISHLARIILGGIVKPLQALGHMLTPSAAVASTQWSRLSHPSSSTSPMLSDVSHHCPSEILKNFRDIRRLRIEFPAGELGLEDGVLLKWKAEFGSTLDSCVILGAASVLSSTSLSPISSNPSSDSSFQDACMNDDNGSMPESFYSNGNLKLRLFWTISSMIAASARHYVLQPIISEHETLETLELTDVDGQGLLTMGQKQLHEFRVKPSSTAGSSQRTLVPALSMRLWYAPYLELRDGVVLKGATLVAVRPSQDWGSEFVGNRDCGGLTSSSEMCWISSAFKEPYRSAVGMLMKRRSYCLEMNSF
ncbi:F-box protein At5g46170-like [Zingiber officinale]|uniref:F-box domain-containing protein n=1 Tax=Zingiber officinale TaxID=94328 RepID=A0A8J5HL05_ZINOF|nr:F-box protein At5g46170-like [Zingiber officinale]KAG6526235.1 hypothetical protein ZIOFF_016217 [Zingiber officinale]